ncbi:hypothetical protein C440_02703 [Haloferax mucosum ATCC BAA-1512]|uniref:Uncharacterized protein n=1 Tax=Haloferax mucosum ATCC BAA-1512 TaxID=662479 RepID=M0IQ14_9EURY|nr:transcriptional regulator [Haloferax mucosum]ELZ98122.1 hypothetical protein C440_02703 [Haloferax mucosum ATCC BAA-1512]
MAERLTSIVRLLNRRQECLQELTESPQAKRDLVDALDMPRSTLDDIVRKLDDAGLVAYRNGTWHLTHLGQYALDAYVDYANQIESLLRATPVIEELPPNTTIGYRFLIDADVYTAPTEVPDKIVRVFLESVESATEIRGFTPIVMAGYAEDVYRAATSGEEYQLDFVLPRDVFEQVQTLFPEKTHEATADKRITVAHRTVPSAFSLWIADDDHAGVIVYTDRGIRGILINDTEEALDWAVEQYERVRDGGKQKVKTRL